jgi:hypothetical protein
MTLQLLGQCNVYSLIVPLFGECSGSLQLVTCDSMPERPPQPRILYRKRIDGRDFLMCFSTVSRNDVIRMAKQAYDDWKNGAYIFKLDEVVEPLPDDVRKSA